MKAALALLAAAPLVLAEPAVTHHAHGASSEPSSAEQASCRDRIQQVREGRGLPELDRRSASPDRPFLMAAVDKRIDGCSVIVMRHDTRDVRPLPLAADAAPELLPAR